MANPQEIPVLIPLAQQIFQPSDGIIAFRHNKSLSTAMLRKRVTEIYQALEKSQIHCWAIAIQDSFDFVAGLLALFYSGKHPVLLNPLHREMDDYYQALLTDNDEIKGDTFPNHHIVNVNRLKSHYLADFSAIQFRSSTLTIFTSGSTGLPKPIKKTVRQLEKESELLTAHFGSFNSSLFIASVAHDHLYGLTFKIMLALANHVPFVCERIHYQEQLATYCDKKVIYITTPSMIKTLDSNINNICCEGVFSAGGPLSYQAANQSLQCLGILPYEIYGSSETGVIATRIQHTEDTPWQLLPQIELTCTEEQSTLYSPLLDQAELLNDKISIVNRSLFHLNGRLDKIVKIAEKRVSLTYIENQLALLPEIIAVTIIPIEQEHRTILGAIVILSNTGRQKQQLGHFQLTQYFRQQLKKKLSLVTIPKKWRFVNQFPVNHQGKSTYMELKVLFDGLENLQ